MTPRENNEIFSTVNDIIPTPPPFPVRENKKGEEGGGEREKGIHDDARLTNAFSFNFLFP